MMKNIVYMVAMALAPLTLNSIKDTPKVKYGDPANEQINYQPLKQVAAPSQGSLLNLYQYGPLKGSNLAAGLYFAKLKENTGALVAELERRRQEELKRKKMLSTQDAFALEEKAREAREKAGREALDMKNRKEFQEGLALGKQRDEYERKVKLADERARIESQKNTEYEDIMAHINKVLPEEDLTAEKPDFTAFGID